MTSSNVVIVFSSVAPSTFLATHRSLIVCRVCFSQAVTVVTTTDVNMLRHTIIQSSVNESMNLPSVLMRAIMSLHN